MRYTLALLAIVLLVFVSCQSTTTPGKPSVTYAPTDNGAMLRLTWPAVTDAEGYYIYLDGTKDTTITGSGTITYDVAGPAKEIEVSAYNGSEESDAWTLDLTPVSTPTLTVYGASDPASDHPSGLALKDAGAVVLAIGEAANKPDIDYVFDDRGSFTPMSMVNPGDYDPQINSKGNAISLVTTGQFDDEDFALAPGNYDTKRIPVAQGGVYYLWLDRNNDNYSTDDHFAKIQIISIAGTVVSIKVAYQKEPGLRWVVTP
jgi:hypothetical protein